MGAKMIGLRIADIRQFTAVAVYVRVAATLDWLTTSQKKSENASSHQNFPTSLRTMGVESANARHGFGEMRDELGRQDERALLTGTYQRPAVNQAIKQSIRQAGRQAGRQQVT